MRTDIVKIPNVTSDYVISALSVDQVQELVFDDAAVVAGANGQKTSIEKVVVGAADFIKSRQAPIVAASLNNVVYGGWDWFGRPKDMRWNVPIGMNLNGGIHFWLTPEGVIQALDFEEVTTLYAAIIKFTGLRSRIETSRASEVAPDRGELKAAAIM